MSSVDATIIVSLIPSFIMDRALMIPRSPVPLLHALTMSQVPLLHALSMTIAKIARETAGHATHGHGHAISTSNRQTTTSSITSINQKTVSTRAV